MVKVVVVLGGPCPLTVFGRNDAARWWSGLPPAAPMVAVRIPVQPTVVPRAERVRGRLQGNLWFEETLCEPPRSYCLRRMTKDGAPAALPNCASTPRRWPTTPRPDRPAPMTPSAHGRLAGILPRHGRAGKRTLRPRTQRRHRVVLLELLRRPHQWQAIRWRPPRRRRRREVRSLPRKWHAPRPTPPPFITRLADRFGSAGEPRLARRQRAARGRPFVARRAKKGRRSAGVGHWYEPEPCGAQWHRRSAHRPR